MKKLLILTALISAFITAQSQEFKAGILAGASISQVDGDGMGGFHFIGPQGGLFINRQIGRQSALQGELLYVFKGSGIESKPETDFRVEITASYVDLALYYKYLYSDRINIKIGLTPSVLISHKETFAGLEQTEYPEYRKWGLNFSVGGEYYFSDHWFLAADWNYSLLSLRSGKAMVSSYDALFFRLIWEDGEFYNYLKFSLGYKF
ncbi:MAG: porin family protein [Bacteroidales bacterium]|nr:porin family protein [Bacteroidales bacterium]